MSKTKNNNAGTFSIIFLIATTTIMLIAVAVAAAGLLSPQQQQATAQQSSLKSTIEKKFAFTMPGLSTPISNVTVVHESPMTVVLDASQFNTDSLWQAVDMVKARGYATDQIMNYISSSSSVSGPIYHWIVFMSRK